MEPVFSYATGGRYRRSDRLAFFYMCRTYGSQIYYSVVQRVETRCHNMDRGYASTKLHALHKHTFVVLHCFTSPKSIKPASGLTCDHLAFSYMRRTYGSQMYCSVVQRVETRCYNMDRGYASAKLHALP